MIENQPQPPVAPESELARKVRENRPLTKKEVIEWCNWKTEYRFYKATAKWVAKHGGVYLVYEHGRVLPRNLEAYLSGKQA